MLETYAMPLMANVMDISHFVKAEQGSSYEIASWIMSVVDWILGLFGLEGNQTIVTTLYAAVVFGVAIVVGYVAQVAILYLVRQVAKRWNGDLYTNLLSVRFFHKLCRMISPAGVSRNFGLRSKSSTPYSFSSRLIWSLTHCWVTNAFCAAREILSSSAAIKKISNPVFMR